MRHRRPDPLQKLIKFAMACGVGASLGSLMKNMTAMTNLARMKPGPDEMLAAIVRGCGPPRARIVRPHILRVRRRHGDGDLDASR
jgi:hypothetical protein